MTNHNSPSPKKTRTGKVRRRKKPDLNRVPDGVMFYKGRDGFSLTTSSQSRGSGAIFSLAGLGFLIGAAYVLTTVEGGVPGAVVLAAIGFACFIPGIRFLTTLYRVTVSGPKLSVGTKVLGVENIRTIDMAEVLKMGLRSRSGTKMLNAGWVTMGAMQQKDCWIAISTYSEEIEFGKLADPEALIWIREYLYAALKAHQQKLLRENRLVDSPEEKKTDWYDPES